MLNQDVMDFMNRRFPCDDNDDCCWLSGNCYYFAVILKGRFPSGTILYDTVNGHFVIDIDGLKYDWNGIVTDDTACYVEWDKFDEYDSKQKERIIRDCIL